MENQESSFVKRALEAANRYPGFTEGYAKYTPAQLKSAIRSTTKTIAEHYMYLKDPTTKIAAEEWNKLSILEQAGHINKWTKDIERNKDYLLILQNTYFNLK